MIDDQPDRLGTGLLVVLARHECHLPNEGGVHQTRGGSISPFPDGIHLLCRPFPEIFR
jgi:hypothetical protein